MMLYKKYAKTTVIVLMAVILIALTACVLFSFWFYRGVSSEFTILETHSAAKKPTHNQIDKNEMPANLESVRHKNTAANTKQEVSASFINESVNKSVNNNSDNGSDSDNTNTAKIDAVFAQNWTSVVDYISFKDSVYDEHTKSKIEQGIENLRRYGSISGGIRTDEFTDAEASVATLQTQGRGKVLGALAFKPNMVDEADSDFKLKGASVGGRYSEKGFDALYGYYENSRGGRIELSEAQLQKGSSKLQIIKETRNFSLQGTPMMWQTIEHGHIYNADFVSGNHHYNLTTQGIEKGDALNLVRQIIEKNNTSS